MNNLILPYLNNPFLNNQNFLRIKDFAEFSYWFLIFSFFVDKINSNIISWLSPFDINNNIIQIVKILIHIIEEGGELFVIVLAFIWLFEKSCLLLDENHKKIIKRIFRMNFFKILFSKHYLIK